MCQFWSWLSNNVDFQAFTASVIQTIAVCATAHCSDTHNSNFTTHTCELSQVIQILFRNPCSDKWKCSFHHHTHSCKPQDSSSWSMQLKDCSCTHLDCWTFHGSSNHPYCRPDKSSCIHPSLSDHSDILGWDSWYKQLLCICIYHLPFRQLVSSAWNDIFYM